MKALVDATPISGPAWVGSRRSTSRAIELVGTLMMPAVRTPFGLHVAERGERVGGLARLRDDDAERVGEQDRLAVAELARHIDLDPDARELLDPVFADHRDV